MRSCFFLLLLSGCNYLPLDHTDLSNSQPPAAPTNVSTVSSSTLVASLSGLPAVSPIRYRWMQRSDGDRISTLSGVTLPVDAYGPLEIAAELRSRFAAELGIDPISELVLERDTLRNTARADANLAGARATTPQSDGASVRHLRFSQSHTGLPVFDSRLDIHMRGQTVTGWNSSLQPIERQRTATAADSTDWSHVRTLLLEQGLVPLSEDRSSILWVDSAATGENAWRFFVKSDGKSLPRGMYDIVWSVVDPRVLAAESIIHTVQNVEPCSAIKASGCMQWTTGTGDDGDTYNIAVYRSNDFPLPALIDAYSHPYTAENYPDLYGDSDRDDLFFVDLLEAEDLGGIYIIQSNGLLYDPDAIFFYDEYDHFSYGPGPTFEDEWLYGSSVSSLVTLRRTLRYFNDVHHRIGLNNDAQAPLDVVSRIDLVGFNAAWVSGYNFILFGTYAGTSLAVSYDVGAHELTHAVTHFSSDLGYSDQSGALNEAISDIFAVLAEANYYDVVDWRIGEDLPLLPPLRNLKYPSRYDMPEHMSQYVEMDSDNGGIHTNMSIPCKAFQLAAEGTLANDTFYGYDVDPVDRDLLTSTEILGKILYHVLEYRVTPTAEFADWAISMLAAVDEVGLEPSRADAAYESLRAAFFATGILTDAEGNAGIAIAGNVADAGSGAPVAGITVTLELGAAVLSEVTDSAGYYYVFSDDDFQGDAEFSFAGVDYYPHSETVPIDSLDQTSDDALEVNTFLARRPPAHLAVTTCTSPLELTSGTSAHCTVVVENQGDADSRLAVTLQPTIQFDLQRIDFEWLDLTLKTEPVELEGDQDHSDAVRLDFPFPFYFQNAEAVYLATDGYFTFTPDDFPVYEEMSLPNPNAPKNLVAAYWADLDFGSIDRAYVYADWTRNITYIQYDQVPDYLQDYVYTFQVLLFLDGRIQLHYLAAEGTPASWARVGLQNQFGNEGLEVAVNTPEEPADFPTNFSSIELTPTLPPYHDAVVLSKSDCDLMGGQSVAVEVQVDGSSLSPGAYSFSLRLDSNDADSAVSYVPFDVSVL